MAGAETLPLQQWRYYDVEARRQRITSKYRLPPPRGTLTIDARRRCKNGEPDQAETEWHLLQVNNTNPAKAGLEGGADDMGDGSETVTRRYEFYRYGAAPNTLDGETGEAMCSEVNPTTDPNDPNYLHGLGKFCTSGEPVRVVVQVHGQIRDECG